MLNPYLLEGMAAECQRDLRAGAQGEHHQARGGAKPASTPARRHASMAWWRIARRLVAGRVKSRMPETSSRPLPGRARNNGLGCLHTKSPMLTDTLRHGLFPQPGDPGVREVDTVHPTPRPLRGKAIRRVPMPSSSARPSPASRAKKATTGSAAPGANISAEAVS